MHTCAVNSCFRQKKNEIIWNAFKTEDHKKKKQWHINYS